MLANAPKLDGENIKKIPAKHICSEKCHAMYSFTEPLQWLMLKLGG